MQNVLFACLYLFVGSVCVLLVKSKEIEALVGIICAYKDVKPIYYYIFLFLTKLVLVLLFPLLIFIK